MLIIPPPTNSLPTAAAAHHQHVFTLSYQSSTLILLSLTSFWEQLNEGIQLVGRLSGETRASTPLTVLARTLAVARLPPGISTHLLTQDALFSRYIHNLFPNRTRDRWASTVQDPKLTFCMQCCSKPSSLRGDKDPNLINRHPTGHFVSDTKKEGSGVGTTYAAIRGSHSGTMEALDTEDGHLFIKVSCPVGPLYQSTSLACAVQAPPCVCICCPR